MAARYSAGAAVSGKCPTRTLIEMAPKGGTGCCGSWSRRKRVRLPAAFFDLQQLDRGRCGQDVAEENDLELQRRADVGAAGQRHQKAGLLAFGMVAATSLRMKSS
jgi:hypothetical protein